MSEPAVPPSPALSPSALPPPVRAILERLREAGHDAVLVGGCVRDLLRGRPVGDFDVATDAPATEVLVLFDRAIPTGLRHGTVTIPTPSGPVDVTTFRAGPRLEDDLARRDFTVNAVAWRPPEPGVVDPFGGVLDLREGRLRTVGDARARFREDPLRALRAARLAAALELDPDRVWGAPRAAIRPALAGVARERIRRELERLLAAPRPSRGLGLLRRTGIEADLAPGVAEDAHAVVDALPADTTLRLAGWLRGTGAAGILGRLRFPNAVAAEVDRWVRLHPVDRQAPGLPDAEIRRLIRRAGEAGVGALVRLRACELRVRAEAGDPEASAGLERLETLRAAVERIRTTQHLALRRSDLAIDGREVMRVLGCGPNPRVGRALRYLTEQVIEDPSCNTPEALRALLERWAETSGRTEAPPAHATGSETGR